MLYMALFYPHWTIFRDIQMTSSIHWYPWVSIAEANLSNFEQNEANESNFIAI